MSSATKSDITSNRSIVKYYWENQTPSDMCLRIGMVNGLIGSIDKSCTIYKNCKTSKRSFDFRMFKLSAN